MEVDGLGKNQTEYTYRVHAAMSLLPPFAYTLKAMGSAIHWLKGTWMCMRVSLCALCDLMIAGIFTYMHFTMYSSTTFLKCKRSSYMS